METGYKVFFNYDISIKCHDDVLDRPWKKCVYTMGKEFAIPFIPIEGTIFVEGDDEYIADCVYYDLTEGRLVVDVGGELCNGEQEVNDGLNYALSKGWSVVRYHEPRRKQDA